jgi:hypothetical protein
LRFDPSRVHEVLHDTVDHDIPSCEAAMFISAEREVGEVGGIITRSVTVGGDRL